VADRLVEKVWARERPGFGFEERLMSVNGTVAADLELGDR
jgi:hypothetical protein